MKNGELITFKGLHLIGVDGTRIACENTAELITEFGCSGIQKTACTALASVAYDLIERVSFDCQIGSYSLSERNLLDRHLNRLEVLGLQDSVLVGDRGYPSYDLMELENKTEYLMTNLGANILSIDEAKQIYSRRWNVETFFGFLKTELELENFSGKTKNAVLQEYYATMMIANLCQCFINDADIEIAERGENSDNIYTYQANRRQCVGQIVPVFFECLLTESRRKQNKLWKEVEQFCERFSEPIRPGRNPLRKTPRDKKFYANARKPGLS